jgi:hypothetical protein
MKNLTKVIVIFSLISLSSAILIAHVHPATGWELDIYASTPILTWFFLIIAALSGAGIIIQQVVTKGYESSRTWLSGLLLLIMSRLVLLYVPFIRGYYTWHGDNLDHWGYIKDILSTGHFYTGNFYPATHSLISQTVLVTDIPIQLVTNLSTAVFSVFFIVAIYLLATAVLPKRGQQLLATVIAAIVVMEGGYNFLLMPNGWSILMCPLLFYFYFKRQSISAYVIPFLLLIMMYPFFHPLSTLMIASSLLVVFLFRQIIRFYQRNHNNDGISTKSNSALIPAILELVILIPWILSFNAFDLNLRQMWQQITSGGSNVLEGIGDILSKINMHGFDAVILFVKLYGADIILILLSLVGLILIWRQIKRANNTQKLLPACDIGVAFLFFGFLYVLYYLGAPGLGSIGGIRLICYTIMFTPILAAITLFRISQTIRCKFFSCILLLVLLAIPAGLSSLDLYHSPYNIEPNLQITLRNIRGMEWFLENKDPQIITLNVLSTPYRFAEGLLGNIEANKRTDFPQYGADVPDHFAYDSYSFFGESQSKDRYLVLNDVDRLNYTTVWQMVGRFNDADFEKLEGDPTVDKLYSNGETDIYYVHAIVLSP